MLTFEKHLEAAQRGSQTDSERPPHRGSLALRI